MNDLREWSRVAIGLSKLQWRVPSLANPIARFDAPGNVVRTRLQRHRTALDGRTRRIKPGSTIRRHPVLPHGSGRTQMSVRAENTIVIKAPLASGVFQA